MHSHTFALLVALLAPAAHAATITVTTLDDTVAVDGQCSLREAFANAASNSAGHPDCAAGVLLEDTIVFNPGLFPGPSGLVGVFQIDPQHGPLVASGGILNVSPPTNSKLHIIGNNGSRLLEIQQPANRSTALFRTHLIEGYSSTDGGAILVRSGSILHLEDCDVRNNHADGSGGAIGFDLSTNVLVRTVRTRFYQNSADGDGGAIGGVMTRRINIDLDDSLFIQNTAPDGRGGAVFLDIGSAAVPIQANHIIADTVFADNAANSGGAVHVAGGSDSSNRYDLLIEDSRFSGNQSLAENSAGRGGAVRIEGLAGHAAATATLRRNSFHDNIDHGSATGLKAGALYVAHADAIVENSLFAHNRASSGSGALAFVSMDDQQGFPAQPRVLDLRFNSFFENELASGGGIGRGWDLLVRVGTGTALDGGLQGNLFKSHPALDGQLGCAFQEPTGDPYPFPGDYNLADRGECVIGSNSIGSDPQVSYQGQTNGRHERILSLDVGSPGRDLIPSVVCLDSLGDPLTEDLPLVERPIDGNDDGVPDCDAGAFEARRPKGPDDDIFADGFDDPDDNL